MGGDILEVTFCPWPKAILGEPSHGVLEPMAKMDTRMLTRKSTCPGEALFICTHQPLYQVGQHRQGVPNEVASKLRQGLGGGGWSHVSFMISGSKVDHPLN